MNDTKNTTSVRLLDSDKENLIKKYEGVQTFFTLMLDLEKEGLIDLLLKKRQDHLKKLKL